MKKIIIYIFLLTISKPTVSQWVLDYQFTNNIGVTSISVTDTNYIWIIIIDSSLNRKIFKKSGQLIINVNSGIIFRPLKVIATDTASAYLSSSNNRLYSTSNSGSNWLVKLDSTQFGYDFHLSRFSANYIVAGTSIYDSNKSAIFISSNSGLNWLRQSIPFNEDYVIFDIKYSDPANIYAGMSCPLGSCSNLQYLYSNNGGINWDFKNFPLVSNNRTLLAPVFNNNNSVGFTFAVGFNFYRYKTSNGGLNWSQPEFFSLGNTEGMQGIMNIDSTSIWFCATSNKVFKTTNDGINWVEMTIPLSSGEFITGFDFIRKDNKYYGYLGTGSDNGKIYKLVETVSPIGIQPVTTEIPKQFSLSQNYPNPFNPVTKIGFSLPAGGNVKINIFDVLGRNIKTAVNEDLAAGTYEIEFDASALPSGIYYYKFEAETSQRDLFTVTKKMVLVK